MTQINPGPNQTSFPITVGLLSDPLRIAFFCPSTGLHLDTVYNAHYGWTGSTPISLTLSPDSAMAPSGYSNLSAHAVDKPFSTVQLTIVQDGAMATLSRPFPTSTLNRTADFNVWIEGTPPGGGGNQVLAWVDPGWPVGKTSSGGPGIYAAEQTDYYYMKTLSQTIGLTAQGDGNVDWLQTPYGAMVGKTAVVSPPLGASVGQAFTLVVSVDSEGTPYTTTVVGVVGTASSQTLTYMFGRTPISFQIHVLAEPMLLAVEASQPLAPA